MIRQFALSLAALGLMIAGANAAQMPVAPVKQGMAVHASHLATGRSAYGHWHHRHHYHRHWHHH